MSRKHIKDARRLQLIDANMACIARYGLSDTTITHVSQAASMSRGIVNFYFESKEKMMRETLAGMAEDYCARLEQAVAESDDAFKAVVEAHFSPKLCNPKRLGVWMAFMAHAAAHPAYRKIFAASHERVVEIIVKASTALVQGRDAKLFAAELSAIIHGMWQQFLLMPDIASREAMAERCLAIAGYGAAPARKAAPAAVKQAKPAKKPQDDLPLLDFGDLFAKKA